jgi:hypothetical protein
MYASTRKNSRPRFLIASLAILTLLAGGCVDPLPLGPAILKDGEGRLSLPMQVSTAFGPTGFFWNTFSATDSTGLRVDSLKWRKYLAFQSIAMKVDHCPDRPAALTLKDRHECLKFIYTPIEVEDLFAGVFWLPKNNFGTGPGMQVAAGSKTITFWARSMDSSLNVTFGAGLRNAPNLKPMPFYSRFPDTWGAADTVWTPFRYYDANDSLVVASLPAGKTVATPKIALTPAWTKYELDLTVMNGGSPLGVLDLKGAFYWSIQAVDVAGSATFFLDGIQYE